MTHTWSKTSLYGAWGALFGALFPIGATAMATATAQLPFVWSSIASVQRAEPLLWIVDSAPLWLGLFAAFAGWRQDRLEQILSERHDLEGRILHEVISQAIETDDPDEMFAQVARAVGDLAGWPVAAVLDVPPGDSQQLIPTSIWRSGEPLDDERFQRAAQETAFRRGDGLSGRILAAGAPVWLEDARGDADLPQLLRFVDDDLRGAAGFPVWVGGEIVSVLVFFSRRTEPRDERLLRVFETLTGPVGRVAERARTQQALRAARDSAEAASTAKSEFLARMSHELRTPLNSVIGFSNLLLKNRSGALSDRELTYLSRIRDNGGRLLNLVDEVLDISKIESGTLEVAPSLCSASEIVGRVAAEMAPRAEAQGLSLSVELPEDLLPMAADPDRLREVLSHLVDNALKFTHEGGVTLRVIAREGARDVASIEVSDTGIGVPEGDLDRIFEAFHQLDGASSRRYEGAGLGLTIARAFCEAMGLALTAEPADGGGSTFRITAPDALDAALSRASVS